jgi:arginyl-tRNA synthetase
MYFKQLFKTLELMGFKNAKNCYHLSYGLVQLKEGKMSSREGNIISYDSLMKDVLEKAMFEVKERHKNWQSSKIDETAKKIALAAIKFSMLSKDANRTIIFEPQKAIRFDGETGPYIQYVYTRCNSILNKANISFENPKLELLTKEIELIKILSQFDEIVESIAINYQLHLLPRYLLNLSQAFNNYYENNKVIIKDKDIMISRLYLISVIKETIKKGLELLGIDVLNQM